MKDIDLIIFSDSHGEQRNMLRVIEQNKNADAFIHLGDGAKDFDMLAKSLGLVSLCVSGNCDRASLLFSENTLAKEIFTEFGQFKFFICHGDMYSVKWGLDNLIRAAVCRGADAVLFGHTHQSLCRYTEIEQKGIYLVNPGSIRDGCYARCSIRDKNILFNCTSI